MAHRNHIRWYNPRQDAYEWREVPRDDDQARKLLEGSPYSPKCTDTYQEWRKLGATITIALIRAGEAAKEVRDEGDGR